MNIENTCECGSRVGTSKNEPNIKKLKLQSRYSKLEIYGALNNRWCNHKENGKININK